MRIGRREGHQTFVINLLLQIAFDDNSLITKCKDDELIFYRFVGKPLFLSCNFRVLFEVMELLIL